MARRNARREDLAEAATDYALETGLIGLSLRPLATAIGTSDRMLLYHFRDKDDLVATVLRVSNDRSVGVVRAEPPAEDVRTAVHRLWEMLNCAPLERCQRMYVEAAALGLLGKEPYVSVVREANAAWGNALADYLVSSGVPAALAARAEMVLDAAFIGFQLDLPLAEPGTVEQAVADVADAVVAIAEPAAQAS